MTRLMAGMILGAWALLGMACLVDSAAKDGEAARASAPADTCVAPLCYPDPRPPRPR